MNHAVLAGRWAVGLVVLALLSVPSARADGLQPGLWRVLSRPVIDGVAGRGAEKTNRPPPFAAGGPRKNLWARGRPRHSTFEWGRAARKPPRPNKGPRSGGPAR